MTAHGADFAATAASTRALAERILAALPPEDPHVVMRRRCALLAEVYGTPDPNDLPRRVLVRGVWRWQPKEPR